MVGPHSPKIVHTRADSRNSLWHAQLISEGRPKASKAKRGGWEQRSIRPGVLQILLSSPTRVVMPQSTAVDEQGETDGSREPGNSANGLFLFGNPLFACIHIIQQKRLLAPFLVTTHTIRVIKRQRKRIDLLGRGGEIGMLCGT